jgi:hypothetical protein
LQIAFGCAGTEDNLHFHHVVRRLSNETTYRTGACDEDWDSVLSPHRHKHGEAENNKSEARSGPETHALADAFSEWLPDAPPAIDFRRCGSFS